MSDRLLTVEVYSDVVCPWCYVGKRRLERALNDQHIAQSTQVIWCPFQLNPTMPKSGMDRRTYLKAKFGSLDSFRRLEEHVLAAGEGEGISFAFEKIARTPNTFSAHRLIWYAHGQGCQDAVVESLFKGYFEEGADIGSLSTLAQLAARAGLQADQFLMGDAGVAEVQLEEAAGHRLGIRGVPYFVLNHSSRISGAQPVEVFVSEITKVRAQATAAAAGLAGRG